MRDVVTERRRKPRINPEIAVKIRYRKDRCKTRRWNLWKFIWLESHHIYPISRFHGQAMLCLIRVFWRKWIALNKQTRLYHAKYCNVINTICIHIATQIPFKIFVFRYSFCIENFRNFLWFEQTKHNKKWERLFGLLLSGSIHITIFHDVIMNTLKFDQSDWHFADHIFKCIPCNEKYSIVVKMSLKLVTTGLIDNVSPLVPLTSVAAVKQ